MNCTAAGRVSERGPGKRGRLALKGPLRPCVPGGFWVLFAGEKYPAGGRFPSESQSTVLRDSTMSIFFSFFREMTFTRKENRAVRTAAYT